MAHKKNIPKKPLVSIVILNWNGLKDTITCLEYVRKLNYPNYEVIVVDNGSSDTSKDYLSKLSDIVYVNNKVNRGFTGGHIDGLKRSSGEYVVLLNNDAVMKADYLEKALQHFDDPLVAVVGGRSYWWDDEYPVLDERNPYYTYQEINIKTGEAQMLTYDYGAPQEVNNVSGSCVVIKRAVINEVGYLYDRFFAYFEETDLFARMKRAGYKVLFDPSLHIWHRNGASSGSRSGSHFFYYQIFRNRFIFATRNFENRFLLRFWLIYARIAFGSGKRLLLGRGDKIMNKAYFQAALHNLITLPQAILSRFQLWQQLGSSSYNHLIFFEQAGTSIVIDCSSATTTMLHETVEQIRLDENPLHEYIFVSSFQEGLPELPPNARYVIDRKYFQVLPINLGVLAAKFSWMLICEVDDIPNIAVINNSISHSFDRHVQMLAFGRYGAGRSSYVFLHKSLFEKVGGIHGGPDIQSSLSRLVNYTRATRNLHWQPMPSGTCKVIPHDKLTLKDKKQLKNDIRLDRQLLKTTKPSLFGRIQNKYYRFYQLVALTKWLFVWRIPPRLKLARLKNLVVYSLCLQTRNLGFELKHMRNEVVLYDRHRQLVKQQQSVIKQKLNAALGNTTDIPIFIICFERIYALKQLISWLESHSMRKIVLIDNGSSYPPLLDFYKKTSYQVLSLKRNIGHIAPWSLAIVRSLVPENFYFVSDPDVVPTEDCPEDFVLHFLKLHKRFLAYQKVGFGLKINDLPDHYPLKDQVISWESQFWKHVLVQDVYEAGIDTTFALYKPFTYTYCLHPSIRTGEPYAARHLPWYTDPEIVTEEEKYYRFRMDPSVNSWNVNELLDRYAQEIGPAK